MLEIIADSLVQRSNVDPCHVPHKNKSSSKIRMNYAGGDANACQFTAIAQLNDGE